MKININGITRDMTPEEEAAHLALAEEPMPKSPEERIEELEAMLAALLRGDTDE